MGTCCHIIIKPLPSDGELKNNKMSGETWRKSVSILSETVFPGIGWHEDEKLKSRIVSSLPLQMSLYFNAFFFPVWLTTTLLMMTTKFECLTSLYRFIATTVHIATAGIEILRIYLGYTGNLSEKIPEVAGFWMISILLQLPLQIFMISSKQLFLKPIEYTVQGIMMVLLLSQLFIGYFALRAAAKHQALKFHLLRLRKAKQRETTERHDTQF